MEQYTSSSSPFGDVTESKLGSKLTEALNEQHQSSITDTDNVGDQEHVYVNKDAKEEGDYEEDEDLTAEILAQGGYGKIGSRKDSNVGDQECICEDGKEAKSELAYAEDETSSRMSWPSDKKIVSAFKGSREKEGLLDRKVCVTWAPDVYDPPITSDDHFPQNKSEKHKGENKKQKGKQKREGKSGAREGKGKGKDKKQTHKHRGSSNK